MYDIARAFGCCRFTCAYCPDGFVGDHYLSGMRRRKVYQAMLHLKANHLLGFACLVLLQVFADANDGPQSMIKSRERLLVHHFIGFAKVGAPLGVTKNDGSA